MFKIIPQTFVPFVWHFIKPYKSPAILYVSLIIFAGFWGPLNALLVREIIDLLPTVTNDYSGLLWLAGLMVINFIILDNVTWRTAAYIRYRYLGKIKMNLIHDTSDYLLKGSHQFFQDQLSGQLSQHIITLADNLERILNNIGANMLRGASLLVVALLTTLTVSPIFFVILLIWFCVFSGFSLYMSRRLVKLSDIHTGQESKLSGQLVDVISNNMTVRLFAAQNFEMRRFGPFFKRIITSFQRKEGFALIIEMTQGASIAMMMAASLYCLIDLYVQKQITVGDFALIMGMSLDLAFMMWFTMEQVDQFNQAYGKCRQSFAMLIRRPTLSETEHVAPKKIKGDIAFNKVTFQYKGVTPLFSNLSVHIRAGEKVGLVGFSGGGKTSFVHLLLRLYDVTEGQILIDEHDVKNFAPESLRSQIAFIPQDPTLFHRSLWNNIRYGDEAASDQDVMLAAQKAHAHEFIMTMPYGYDSWVGERGVKLSGGQRQRIAIARAFLKQAPILILDEATSQLDSVTEGYIQESLHELMQNKTTLVIAHRLSTLQKMDRLLVFNKGKIVESGTHHTLLAQDGLYKSLWNAQIGGFLGDEVGVK